jgi:dTDP-4-amino-4,6-dideoxygalactose transaminase
VIPLFNLQAQYAAIKPEIDAAVEEVLVNGQYVLGPAVSRFEEAFAAYSEAKYGIAVNSGTSSLHLALLAAGIGKGDEVITTAATFVATAAAIAYTGATPVLADTLPGIALIDPDAVEAAITPKTKAILPVHLHGHVCDMDRLRHIAAGHGLVLIEDCSQAHGARYKGRRVGSLGDMACFSCYPGKNLGGIGEGGIITTRSEGLARKMRTLRNWGQGRPRVHTELAFNYRMDGIQGAVLGVKLNHLDRWNEARRANAAAYDAALAATPFETPRSPEGTQSVYHVYAIGCDDRDQVGAFLNGRGVATGVHYSLPVHRQPGYTAICRFGALPNTERQFARTLSLPICPALTESQRQTVIGTLLDYAANPARAVA